MSSNRDAFRDQWWIDISFQLLCFGVLDASNFDGPLLRTDIPNGIWLQNSLVRTYCLEAPLFTSSSSADNCSFQNRLYQEHVPTQRRTINITVLQPDSALSQCFTLKLEVMVRRSEFSLSFLVLLSLQFFGRVVLRKVGEVTRFFTFPQPFGSVAPPVTAPAPSTAAPAAEVPGPSSSGGDGVSGGSEAAGGSSGSGGSGDFGGSGGSGGGGVPGCSGGS